MVLDGCSRIDLVETIDSEMPIAKKISAKVGGRVFIWASCGSRIIEVNHESAPAYMFYIFGVLGNVSLYNYIAIG